MKTSSFLTGVALGAVAAFLANKKFGDKLCPCSCKCDDEAGDSAAKEAEDAVEKLRGSVDSLTHELNKRIESEQTFAAKCKDLEDKVLIKETEIENLKNTIAANEVQTRKLEEELDRTKK